MRNIKRQFPHVNYLSTDNFSQLKLKQSECFMVSVLQILKKCIQIHLVSAIKMWGICSLIQSFFYLKRKNNQSCQKIQTSFTLYCDH